MNLEADREKKLGQEERVVVRVVARWHHTDLDACQNTGRQASSQSGD